MRRRGTSRGRAPARGGRALPAAALLCVLCVGFGLPLPGPAGAQPAGTGGGDAAVYARSWAIVAYDPAAGHLGVAAASTAFSVGSGGALLDPAAGAVAVLGRPEGAGARSALEALRAGRSPASAAGDAAGGDPPAQVAALTPECDRASERSGAAAEGAESRPGRAGGLCYLAVGLGLRDAARLDLAVRSFRSADGGLLPRFLAALSSMDSASLPVGGSRSAVVWVAAGEEGEPVLGRRELRLDVADHERPALALEKRLEAGRADWLARRAGRLVDRGEHERAATLADSALSLDVSAPLAWLQKGRAQLHRGRVEEAEIAFQRMLELDPYLLRLLGAVSGGEITVREDVIPYFPRLVLRLDLYRRAYFEDLDFGPEPEPFGAEPGG